MKDWDFGYFGKGLDGYAQYTTAFKRNQKENKTLNAQKATSVRIDYPETPTKPCTPKEKNSCATSAEAEQQDVSSFELLVLCFVTIFRYCMIIGAVIGVMILAMALGVIGLPIILLGAWFLKNFSKFV